MSSFKEFSPKLMLILSDKCPHIDEHVHDYIIAVLCGDEFDTVSDVFDAIGEMLVSCSENGDNTDDVMAICNDLFNAINKNGNDTVSNGHKTLESPIDLSALRLESYVSDDWRSIWSDHRDIDSKVDSRKLEKAEAKLKAKAEKRDTDIKPILVNEICKEASANQMMSKRDMKQESRGTHRTKDIKIENFDIAFGDHVLLMSAELTLAYGRRYGLCGRNGIGKSTLLRMISNGSLMIPNHITILHVEQEVIGDDKTALESVLDCDTVRSELITEERHLSSKKALTNEETSRLLEIYQELGAIEADKAPAKASVILSGLGFSSKMQSQATREFSGGWRMRIALARALFSKPDLLLLDEPTNMLDMKAIIWLENYLTNEWQSTLLVVSHDRKFLSLVPTDILHFHSHRIDSYRGDYEHFVKSMTEKLKNQQREYDAQLQYRQHAQEFIDKFRYNAKRASLVQSKIKALERLPELKPVEKESSVIIKFANPEALSPPILQLDEASFAYESSKQILTMINLNANLESRICIVGDNGSGKTTLLKLLTGELSPSKGIRHAHRNLSIGYFSQHHVDQLNMNQTPIEFLASKFPGKPSEHYRRYLGSFGISGDLGVQSVASLSGGQKSRVAFSAIAMLNPHILILDEPTNHLDVETVEALGLALNEYKGGVILVTHDEQLITIVCKELWHCRDGSVRCLNGGFEEYREIIDRELANI